MTVTFARNYTYLISGGAPAEKGKRHGDERRCFTAIRNDNLWLQNLCSMVLTRATLCIPRVDGKYILQLGYKIKNNPHVYDEYYFLPVCIYAVLYHDSLFS